MRHTARAIIIKQKKLLLVTGHGSEHYWSPGGGIESDETPLEALSRELFEELGVKVSTSKPYKSYIVEETKQRVDNFLVETSGKLNPGNEVSGIFWLSKDDFLNKEVKVSLGLSKILIPSLIKDKLL
ncbi:MAG: NUDIX domain-containing protein [bacterium]